MASTNLATVFASMNFDPLAPNSAIIVQISDIHMSVTTALTAMVTNVDERLLAMVTQMNPAPARIVFAGDFAIAGSGSFGALPDTNACLAELMFARQQLLRFTNAPLVAMPGNHDTYGTEGNTPILYHTIFSNSPAYGSFEVKGLKAFYLYGHNSGTLDPPQEAWLRSEIGQLNTNQQVAIFVHQPPLGGVSVERGITRPLMESFQDWVAPVWAFAGHAHTLQAYAFGLGRTNIYQIVVPSANPLISTSPNPLSVFTAGFQIICVRDAQIAGIVFAALTNATYYPVGIPTDLSPLRYQFEEVPRPLLLREEGTYDRTLYEEWCKSLSSSVRGADTGDWWAYVHRWRVRLPLGDYQGLATHALLSTSGATPDTTNVSLSGLRDFKFWLGTDTNNLMPAPVVLCSNSTAWIEIPPALRTNATLWLELTNNYSGPYWEMHIGGWGLATTNSTGWPMPSRFTSAQVNPDGSHALRALAIPQQPYRIESSSNLVDWVTNQLISNPSGIIEWVGPGTHVGLRRFYRIGNRVP